ncbi:MAG: hypothetical protein IKU11_06255 [Clostridia bacterium]|nr:hypothetical protein [Clostridia bacterium]
MNYASFFKTAAVILLGAFIFIRTFVENAIVSDITLSAALVGFFLLCAGGLIFDKTAEEAESKSYKNFTIASGVVVILWGIMLLSRYVFFA